MELSSPKLKELLYFFLYIRKELAKTEKQRISYNI